MYRLSFLILLLICGSNLIAQNPHGEELKIDCKACHNPGGWNIDRQTLTFEHDTVGFNLEFRHAETDCMDCHKTLVFNDAQTDCVACHEDVHSMSVGDDCARCHTPSNWLVDNIPEIHEQNGFPLVGGHFSVSCVDCHKSETNLRWDRIGNDCVECHLDNYNNSTEPDHIAAGFSTDCVICHEPVSDSWGNANFHFFFALTGVHDVPDCNQCHTGTDYANISSDCAFCHQEDYNNAQSVDHQTLNLSTDCTQCHTLDPGWTPAKFSDHDGQFFPIYSGKHQGEWSVCTDCHTNPNDYSDDSCIICHSDKNELAKDHDKVSGYSFDSDACYACHPTGDE
jgi:hypothetical protein